MEGRNERVGLKGRPPRLLSAVANLPSADGLDLEFAPEPGAAFLAGSDPADWERIERFGLRRRFSRGEDIVRQGEVDRSLIVLLTGSVEFVVRRGDGAEQVLNLIDAPSIVGEVAFFDPGPRSGTLRARTAGELLQISFAQFEALAASSPALARRIALDAGRVVAQRLRRTTELLAE